MNSQPEHDPFEEPIHRPGVWARIRSSFLTGIVVIAPVGLTIWLIWTVIGWIDSFVLPFVPERLQPETYIGVNLRGVGVVIFVIFAVFIGWIAKGIIGRSLIRFAENLVNRMPVVRTIYSGIKQISETVFAQTERNFEKACLVQYPRKGIWAIAFISTHAKGEIVQKAETGGRLMSVFLPTTPNPTSGFLLFVPEEDVIVLDMSIEDAAKLVISAGLVYPDDLPKADKN
ncbi:DUF502 domain-containing protein [Jhaorihella thermophila]|uniref:Uncharacterized membrane protein n=1 Tax=Jhaorihella thermophila TaxID=488547 RepID=A0A1H5SLL7_9RHOB|nr:DUF502 domain-containing protein [Jhaorihella thermophila]SEF50848.1 Uncharacterized membrane protein [Jhaorihella thermophila]